MRFLYDILFLVGFIISSPYYYLRMRRRGGWQAGFAQRFGKFDHKVKQSLTNRRVLWIHAVSVGEINLCIQLINALEARMPNIKIMVSTTTSTGMEGLQSRLPVHIGKIYYPIDRRKYVSRALTTVHPHGVILVEAEIWPNFIWRARARGTPLFLINARMSDRSFPRYKRFGFLFRELFASFAAVTAQNEEDAKKLTEVGCRREAIHIVGNLKFDSAKLADRRPPNVAALLAQLGVPDGAPVLVAGSTHEGEEDLLAEMLPRWRAKFPELFLILVPRHFERGNEVGRQLERRGIKFVYRSEYTSEVRRPTGGLECLLVNTTGELRYFYEHATVVFVGKSLTAHGGQNPIEPAALGKPVLVGPNMENFADVIRILLAKDGAVQIRNARELEEAVGYMLANPERRAQLGRNAAQIVTENQGAAERTVDLIVQHMERKKHYIVDRPKRES